MVLPYYKVFLNCIFFQRVLRLKLYYKVWETPKVRCIFSSQLHSDLEKHVGKVASQVRDIRDADPVRSG